ncbi:MAG: hypothetical protein QM710_02405 [Flavobacterium sp.]
MKKIILCLGIVAISLTSCSSSDSSSDGSNDVLVKKIVYTSITDDYTETVQFTYNGNKIVRGTYTDGTIDVYTYEGDLITKIETIENDEVVYTETFSYDSSGRLTQYIADESGFVEQETFTYNSNGTVTSTIDGGSSRTLYIQNDEVIKIVEAGAGGRIYDYAYDSKNSPFRNVTGYEKIAFVSHGDHEFFGRKQNISTIHESTEDIDYMTNTMTYNSNNYPITANSTAIFEFDGTYEATMQYTYY